MHSLATDMSVPDNINVYAGIKVQANTEVSHERFFRVTFWAFLSNFSALVLGIYSALFFFLSYLNTYESERAMIQVLY